MSEHIEIDRLVKSAMGKLPFTAPEDLEAKVRFFIETAWLRGKASGAAKAAVALRLKREA